MQHSRYLCDLCVFNVKCILTPAENKKNTPCPPPPSSAGPIPPFSPVAHRLALATSASSTECAVRVPLVRIEASAPDSQNTQRTGGTAALEMLNDTDEYIDLSSGAVAETESAVPENAALSSDERAHGESGSTKSPPILAWRGPSVGADGDGLHPLLTERPRPSYRKESGRGAPGGNGSGSGAVPNSSVEDELSVVCAAGSNNSGGGVYGGGGDNVGVGEGEKGAVSEEIFAWICQICSGGGSEESLGE